MNIIVWLAVLPSIIIALIINKADRVEKEPKKELFKAFILGIIAVVLTLFISFFISIKSYNMEINNLFSIFIYSFIGISLIEEFSKWICACLFLKNNKNFNYLFDGIVYTTFISLGFATIENILYALSTGLSTIIIRSVTTVPAHAFFGISSGYFLSLAKKENINNNKSNEKKYLYLSLFIPFLLHGFYDFCLLSQNYFFLIIYLIFVVSLYSFSIYNVKKMMKLESPFEKKKIMFCQKCGSNLIGNYCGNCGEKIKEDS